MFSNFTNVSPDSLLCPDNPCIRYVGNSFLITWWQYLFDVTRCYRNLSYTPVVSICVRLDGRSAPSADRHYIRIVEDVYTEGCKSRYTVLLCITLITVYLLLHPSVY